MLYIQIQADLKAIADPVKADSLPYFFKTGEGQYAAGDRFIGVIVPEQRKVAKKYYIEATYADLKILLQSPIHEHRYTALEILVMKYQKLAKTEFIKQEIVDFYLANLSGVNNWDLVDTSASYILGAFLCDKPKDVLYKLAKSENLWQERIAVVSTMYFINSSDFADILALAKQFLTHKHDLIHKSVGWMLREVGKKDRLVLDKFLKENSGQMPRTMLRYAIEKHDEKTRQAILKGEWGVRTKIIN